MKKLLHAAFIGLLLISPAAFAEDKQVDIKEYMFVPKDLTITAGTKVTWVNHDQVPHTIAEKNKLFRSSALDTNESYSYTFNTPGKFEYFCTLHPQMTGTITVTAGK